MAKTYIDIVNVVLRDINEVPLTTGNFDTARGLQAFVKEAINRALMDIVNYNDEWPWLTNVAISSGSSPHTNSFTTVADTAQYAIDATAGIVDYDTITILDTSDPDNKPKHLDYVEYDQVVKALDVGTRIPEMVYDTPDNDFIGLYPTPDDAYTVSYISWKDPVLLNNQADEIPFEERFYSVLTARARYYTWMFRGNAQLASFSLNEFDEGIKRMFKIQMLPAAPKMRAV